MSGNATPANVGSNDGLGPLPITRHDHPEPQTMVWSELELHAIRAYAGRCVAAERERCAKLVAAMDNDYLRTSPCRKALERAAKVIRMA